MFFRKNLCVCGVVGPGQTRLHPASCRDSLISLLGSGLSAALSSSPAAVLCAATVRALREEVSSQDLPALP